MKTYHRAWIFLSGLWLTAACTGARPPKADAAEVLRSRAGAYAVEVLVQGSRPAPMYSHQGQHFVLGTQGSRYVVRVHNRSASRIEAVVSVDGRDVLDGKAASFAKRGYIVEPWRHVDIDGWRLSDASVAAFRFSSVRNSYAAMTGDARNVGVIGVAVFDEARRKLPPVEVEPRPVEDSPDPLHGMNETHDRGELEVQPQVDYQRRSPSAGASTRGIEPRRQKQGDSSGAPGSSESRSGRAYEERSGLGTEFGEVRSSHVRSTWFERASSAPAAVLGVRYNDRQGLLALGIDVDGVRRQQTEARRRMHASPFQEAKEYAVPPGEWRYR